MPTKRTRRTRPFTVLVVDDDREIRSVLSAFLTARGGLQLFEASDGLEAVEVLSRNPADLIISDLHMPRMNGLELASFVLSNPATREAKFLLFTSDRDTHTRRKAMAHGIRHHVNKPFDPVEFSQILDELLSPRRRRRTAGHPRDG